ncbi:hypothetical protein FBEOM_1574 [Fusarium beomiforme]|uniref:BTB domain-containing protein n=1 Tax=Fusarium beomiforme TaxID=44412 RepID=A0A9P5ATJ1_9HYPO|nr:hypothetical protein FBEOM_1574 [Fusarium beomiforme]
MIAMVAYEYLISDGEELVDEHGNALDSVHMLLMHVAKPFVQWYCSPRGTALAKGLFSAPIVPMTATPPPLTAAATPTAATVTVTARRLPPMPTNGSVPSRSAFMGFINEGKPLHTPFASRPSSPELETSRPAISKPEVTESSLPNKSTLSDVSEPLSIEPISTEPEVTVRTPGVQDTFSINSESAPIENATTQHISMGPDTTERFAAPATKHAVIEPAVTDYPATSTSNLHDSTIEPVGGELAAAQLNTTQPTSSRNDTALGTVLSTTFHLDISQNPIPQVFVTEPTTSELGLTETRVLGFEFSDNEDDHDFYEQVNEEVYEEIDESFGEFEVTHLAPEPYIIRAAVAAAEVEDTTIEGVEFEVADTPTAPQAHEHALDETLVTESVSSETEKPMLCFDPSGDLYLKVGQNPGRMMLVDSRALCRVSPKLKVIITLNKKSDDSEWTIKFPEDDPAPFALLLNLIHTRFENVPAKVTLKRLYGVCVLTNKYNMTQVLRPVAERWYKTVGRPAEDYGLFFKRAFVAWELGYAEDLSDMVGHVVLNCHLDKDNQLVIGENKERLSDFKGFQRVPVLECIADHRELVMETFWHKSQTLSEMVLYSSVNGNMCGTSHSREDMCLMLGKMLSKAGEEGILHLFSFGSHYAVFQTSDLDLMTLEYKISLVADYIDLCGLCPVVFEMVDTIRHQLLTAADPLYLHHFKALETQAAKVRMMPTVPDDDGDDDE